MGGGGRRSYFGGGGDGHTSGRGDDGHDAQFSNAVTIFSHKQPSPTHLYKAHSSFSIHRGCNVLYIPDHLTSLFDPKHVQKVLHSLDTTVQELKTAVNAGKIDIHHQHRLKARAIQAIYNSKRDIIACLDEMERATIEDLNVMCKETDAVTQTHSSVLSKQLSDAEDVKKRINMAEGNEAQAFVCCKIACQISAKQRELYNAFHELEEITFHKNARLLSSLLAETTLGTFSKKVKSRVYRMVHKEVLSIRSTGDHGSCNIFG